MQFRLKSLAALAAAARRGANDALLLEAGAVALACRRQRSSWPLLVFLPVLLNSAIWFGLASFPHVRFQFPIVLAAPLAIPLAALPRPLAGRAGHRKTSR